MKKIFFIALIVAYIGAFAQEKNTDKGAKIDFIKEEFNFGEIFANSGHDGLAEFFFLNTGNEPLVLTNVKAGCGCTSPFWEKEPILPGDTGKVVLKYTTLQHPHTINKTAVVYSNAVNKPSIVIRISGVVLQKPDIISPEKNVDKSSMPFAQ